MHRTWRLRIGALAATLCLIVTGCVNDDRKDGLTGPRDETPHAGRYGALGDSWTAGFINGGLIMGGQVAAYPSLVAQQAGFTPPQLPLIASPGIGSSRIDGIPQSALYVNKTGAIVSDNVLDPLALLRNPFLPRPYDNMSVPGATTTDMSAATDAGSSQSGTNLFFDVVLRNSALPPGNWAQIDAMAARNPETLTLWIGANDILGGALGGNPVVGVNITPPQFWEELFGAIVSRIDGMHATKVAVINIVNITDLPFVTTAPIRAEVAPGIFEPFATEETSVEYVLLPFASELAANGAEYLPPKFGGTKQIPSSMTLTTDEVAAVAAVVQGYNEIIKGVANERGWALVDVFSIMDALPSDPTNPGNFAVPNAIFPWLPGPFHNKLSAFSLDGVHGSELGQAIAANAVITALNVTYGTNIDPIDLTTIENEVGFESAPGGSPAPLDFEDRLSLIPDFGESGLAGLESTISLLGLGR